MDGKYEVSVYNSQGALVQRNSISGTSGEIDLTEKLMGIYYLVVDGINGEHHNLTLIKE